MPLNLASPGILVREVDLTVGRVDPTSGSIGAIAAPFAQGPVDLPTLVENEKDLLDLFGKPYSEDKHYEHWLTASSFLAYGGSLRVVRTDGDLIKNALVGDSTGSKIKSSEHYEQLGYDNNTIPDVTVIARNPGSWGNGLRIGIIDGLADQIVSLASTAGVSVGYGITQSISATLPGAGATSVLDGYLKGIVTKIEGTLVSVKILTHVSAEGTATKVDYQPSGVYTFSDSGDVGIYNNSNVQTAQPSVESVADWYDRQSLQLTESSSISWESIAPRPSTTKFGDERGARFDEVHVVVIDGDGSITGNAGSILEKHLGLSKAKDAEFSFGTPSYWRSYVQNNSEYIFAGGDNLSTVPMGFSNSGYTLVTNGDWSSDAEGIIFEGLGNLNDQLAGGKNYDGNMTLQDGGLASSLAGLSAAYDLFANTDNYEIDFLLMGSAGYPKETAQALANKLIAVAEERKDALAFISPYRGAAISDTAVDTEVNVYSASAITDNVVSFYAPITSSTYAVFDSGYKYMYDRFANTFRYVPLNGDIAGTCARSDSINFPWFSPAGTNRGAILNAVKLAYNPSKSQRDKLYSNRVNPVIFSPGSGIVLFGDKTGFGKSSAFDRINVRRLFIYLEDAISAAAKDQLFEFNDEITRTNFVNIVEPFLRDVQAKRGIFDYVVICDETNNTAAVIDNNEFVADIYIKPTRSINFIGLTFVATRTGVSFEEVIGNV